MGLGKRVRISRPPPGKKEWMDKTATVITLVPVAKHPLEYQIRLDENGETMTVPADALEPMKINEERKEGILGYRIVNGLMYCLDHGLEVCGQCGVDHRMTNYQMEITAEGSFDAVDDLFNGMQRIGAPARRAPTKKSKAEFPGNKAVFRPVINDAVLILNDGYGKFDPSACDPWPRGRGAMMTETAVRIHSAFADTDGDVPEFAKLPVRRVRETLVAAARQWDRFLAQKSSGEPMMRLLLQDEAQTRVLSMDLVPPIRSLRVGTSVVPIFVVRWAPALAADMQNALAIMGTMERNTRMGEIPVEVDEIEFLVALLRANSELMDHSFVRKAARHPEILSVSVLTPISRDMQTAYYESIKPYCYQCGTSGGGGSSFMTCSRCKEASYCSRECQKKNWKYHKKSCIQK